MILMILCHEIRAVYDVN